MGQHDQLVRDTFVDLADTLVSDYDVGEFLHLLVQRCEDVLSVTTCGVLVEAPEGVLHLAAATSDQMHRLEQAEIDMKDGPCFEAYRRVELVVSQDLREERQRWPEVVDQALDMGLLPGVTPWRSATMPLACSITIRASRTCWSCSARCLARVTLRSCMAAYAFPLRLRDDCIGALNLYRDEPGAFEDDDVRLAQAFADVATIGILPPSRSASRSA